MVELSAMEEWIRAFIHCTVRPKWDSSNPIIQPRDVRNGIRSYPEVKALYIQKRPECGHEKAVRTLLITDEDAMRYSSLQLGQLQRENVSLHSGSCHGRLSPDEVNSGGIVSAQRMSRLQSAGHGFCSTIIGEGITRNQLLGTLGKRKR